MFWLCYGEYKGKRNLSNFLHYVKAKIGEKAEELTFKVYVTDSFRGIFKALGGEMPTRYYDIIEPKKAETRTSSEIVEGIREKLRRNSEVDT